MWSGPLQFSHIDEVPLYMYYYKYCVLVPSVYDVVTGKVVQSLLTQDYCNCIRDVSWHPTQPGELVSTSV